MYADHTFLSSAHLKNPDIDSDMQDILLITGSVVIFGSQVSPMQVFGEFFSSFLSLSFIVLRHGCSFRMLHLLRECEKRIASIRLLGREKAHCFCSLTWNTGKPYTGCSLFRNRSSSETERLQALEVSKLRNVSSSPSTSPEFLPILRCHFPTMCLLYFLRFFHFLFLIATFRIFSRPVTDDPSLPSVLLDRLLNCTRRTGPVQDFWWQVRANHSACSPSSHRHRHINPIILMLYLYVPPSLLEVAVLLVTCPRPVISSIHPSLLLDTHSEY